MNEANEKAKELLGIAHDDPVDKEIEIGDIVEKEVKFDFLENEKKESTTEVDTIVEPEKPKKKAKKVSLSKINVLEATELEKETDIRTALYGGKSVFQIIAAQSGYMAKVAPLVHKDTVSLLYSNLSRYEYKKAVFKVIYDKIVSISSGRVDFETWLKNTSVEDIETFYYGIYCATFPDEGVFTFSCPNCGNSRDLSVKHSNLFKTADNVEMKKLISNVSKNSNDEASRQKYSLVGKTEAFQLPDSGIIMEIRTPSLWDSLEILRVVPERVIDRDTTSVTNMLYVKKFLIPSKQKGGYIEQTDSQELLRIIDNLSIDDASELQSLVSERVDNHRITYSIKNIKCPDCGKVVEDIPVSIEDILFTLIFEKTQAY